MSSGTVVIRDSDALPCRHVAAGEEQVAVVAFCNAPVLRGLTGYRVVALRVCLACLAEYGDISRQLLRDGACDG